MQCSSSNFDWNAETIERLRSLWKEGLSTAEIGRRLGITKNAVVGKSHRLDLPARPSPIRRDSAAKPPAPRRLPRPKLMELQDQPVSENTPRPDRTVPMEVRPDPAEPTPPTRIVPETMPVPAAILRSRPCCWPIGQPGTRSFRFCEAPNEAGKPYCPKHCGVAYLKREPRQQAG